MHLEASLGRWMTGQNHPSRHLVISPRGAVMEAKGPPLLDLDCLEDDLEELQWVQNLEEDQEQEQIRGHNDLQ